MTLHFDFSVDKTTKTIYITREFAAPLDLVWDAFTKPDLLDQWSAPKPWRTETKIMDFRVGGRWLYAMISPENVHHWSLAEFQHIEPKSQFASRNSFCDDQGLPLPSNFTSSITTTSFTSNPTTTTVLITKVMEDLNQLEQFIARGFQQGSTMAMNNLELLLSLLLNTKPTT